MSMRSLSVLGWMAVSVCCYGGEQLDRGVVATRIDAGALHVSWRLLAADPAGATFNVYRHRGAESQKLNAQPITKTTDYRDGSAPSEAKLAYSVRRVVDGQEESAAQPVPVCAKPYVSIRLQGDYKVQKAGIADLDGDGRLDYVVKQPADNIDPYEKYWKPSPDTYKLEAYRNDGQFLWRYDLGWAIERGIWYSPYVVFDLDGDGRAEVAVKTGEGDPRDKDGRVQEGPEYLSILDGQTGKPVTRIDWPSRKPYPSYNFASRNQLGVAYLDGRTPSLIVERGTYNYITIAAYQYRDHQLREIWHWDNSQAPKTYWGQGAHNMHAADVDGDGRDEIIFGSAVLDDNGQPLWTTGLGHPDSMYVGHIDPSLPGLQIYYNIEKSNPRNSMCLVEAASGKILWGHDQRTTHIHAQGMCSDIDPRHPGCECYGGERDAKDKRWLRTCKGEVISTQDLGSLAIHCAYWDASLQRAMIRGERLVKYDGPTLPDKLEGTFVAVADVLGDWREEVLMSLPGELRIYTTNIPARDRRTCLMQDRLYRLDVVMAAMGYYHTPMTSYDLGTGK